MSIFTSLRNLAKKLSHIFTKKDDLKIPYLKSYVINSDDNEINEKTRQEVRQILYTRHNEVMDKTLHEYFINNKTNAIHKWFMYFDVYERHFARFRGKDVSILEIGVQNGGSARMWKHYFSKDGAKVDIYGVDLDPRCKGVETDGFKVFIGSQEDRGFWQDLRAQIPRVDILIDDGGHTMRQQIITFEEMFDFVKDDGLYLCEDLHTSYWWGWGGGFGRGVSFIDYTKRLIDALNAYHATNSDDLQVSKFTNSAYSITYYDSIIVIEKRQKDRRNLAGAYIGKSML